jgi:hypothetical protein
VMGAVVRSERGHRPGGENLTVLAVNRFLEHLVIRPFSPGEPFAAHDPDVLARPRVLLDVRDLFGLPHRHARRPKVGWLDQVGVDIDDLEPVSDRSGSGAPSLLT